MTTIEVKLKPHERMCIWLWKWKNGEWQPETWEDGSYRVRKVENESAQEIAITTTFDLRDDQSLSVEILDDTPLVAEVVPNPPKRSPSIN